MRPTIALSLLLLALVTTQACRAGAPTQEVLQTAVVAALDTLVAELVAERPADAAAYTERLRAYLEAYPAFYGSVRTTRSSCAPTLRSSVRNPARRG